MTHLHCHSFFSFHRGTIPADELPRVARERGMSAVAITDTNNVTGVIEFYKAAKAEGIKPIVGTELRTPHERVVLLARNNDGYREICQAVTTTLERIPQIKPKLTLEDLGEGEIEVRTADSEYVPLTPLISDLSENVVLLSSSPSILAGLAPTHADRLYIELLYHEHRDWSVLRELYHRYKLPFIASNDVTFRDPSEYELHRVLRAMGTNTTISTVPPAEVAAPSQSFVTHEALRRLLHDVSPDAFIATDRIAEECTVDFDLKTIKFGDFGVSNPTELLRTLSSEGFARRYPIARPVHRERFEHELAIIQQLNATNYFLATHDMIEYAKHRTFPYLGRGSGANSLIAYCLEISNVDPIAHNLRLERFLNPERPTAPDFDIDFSWKDRYEVINYMLDKYGRDRAAMLCTTPRYRGKGAVRELGKAFGAPESDINRFIEYYRIQHVQRGVRKYGRNLPQTQPFSGARLADYAEWDRLAKRIQNFPRYLSVHSGGLIIANGPITQYTATQNAPIGVPITQQDMFSTEDWKLIKLDILATRGLGTYWDTMNMVEARTGVRPPVTDARIAFEDEQTKELIRSGNTRGCFYIESPAMIGLIRKLRTDTFENLTAASSVIRPGVAQSGMMQEFIARHRDPSRREHIHPLMGKLMPDTYGVMVYQEDVLTVAHELAGISYGKADIMRRAMSGKARDHERVSDLKDDFIRGCVANGITEPVALDVWRQIESFSGYSFCKAHSASYAVLSFQEAWLKVYHPAEFMCNVLNNQGGYYRHQEYINECALLGVRVQLPDVNRSQYWHSVDETGAILLGFVAYKDLSRQSLETMLANRDAGGRYTSVDDFTRRSGVTPEDGKLLIELGALDSLGVERPHANLRFATSVKRNDRHGQATFEFPEQPFLYDLSHVKPYDRLYRFRRERACFGYSVSDLPFTFLKPYIAGTVPGATLTKHRGSQVTVVGAVATSKVVSTKKGQMMLMINLSDESGMFDVVIWPDEFQKYYRTFSNAEALRITGTVASSFDVDVLEARTIERLEFTLEEAVPAHKAAA